METAGSGHTVRVHYTGRLDDGTVFDSSSGGAPLEFTLGAGQVIRGFEDAVTGMKPGDERTVTIPPEDAYGPRQEELLLSVSRGELPAELEPEVGQQLQMSQQGQTFVVTIAELSDSEVVLDANHPLAGEALTFELQLVDVA